MIEFILTLFAGVSVANIITSEYIFGWFRKLILKTKIEWLITFVHCVTCMSFWTTLIISFCFHYGFWTSIGMALTGSLIGKIIKLMEE